MSAPKLKITETVGKKPDISKGVKVGDFLVARFTSSAWARHFPWVHWHHAAMITRVNPLTVIETSGILLQRKNKKNKKEEIREGIVEYEFFKPRTVTNLDGSKNPGGNSLADTRVSKANTRGGALGLAMEKDTYNYRSRSS